jgi:hypothetical protein
MGVEALAPLADDLARRIEAGGNDIVVQALGGQQHDLGPDGSRLDTATYTCAIASPILCARRSSVR